MSQGRLSAEKRDQTLSLITVTANAKDLQGCDLIIEAVFENPALKAQVTQEVEAYLAPGGVMASNTSTLPITELAKASQNDANFIGLHFLVLSIKCNWLKLSKGKIPQARL